jgi:hypothetical protein
MRYQLLPCAFIPTTSRTTKKHREENVWRLQNNYITFNKDEIWISASPYTCYYYFLWLCSPARAMASSFTRFRNHTKRRATVGSTLLGRVISSSQRPLLDNAQHTQQTNIHAVGGIRNHDCSRRAAVDLCLRPHDHWDPLVVYKGGDSGVPF